jgi:hypothetical protein
MANVGHHDVEARLLELVYDMPPEGLVLPLRDLARDILAEGHPREELLANFEHVRDEVRRRSRAEENEKQKHVLEELRRRSRTDVDGYIRWSRAQRGLRRRRNEAREDAVLDVMDFVYGWSASHMTI